MVTISIPALITMLSTLIPLIFSAGGALGFFASKYVSKKDCLRNQQDLWKRVDSLQEAMTGKTLHFELKLKEPTSDA